MRKRSLASQVASAYSQDDLARICTLREDRFGRAFGMETVRNPQPGYRPAGIPEDYYHFKDNGARVLAVAHLDTVVHGSRRTPRFTQTRKGPLVVSGALDDRLGAYVILRLLPEMGITCDQLLTVGEESGRSTAEQFEPAGKDYDWIIEFDRAGTDVVMYQYEDEHSVQAVEECGAHVGLGSFSDIAAMENIGVKAFNWGVGYRGNYHSEKGYAYLRDTFAMAGKYLRFHDQNAGISMPHECWQPATDCLAYADSYCFACEAKIYVDPASRVCEACQTCQDCALTRDDGCMCYTPSRSYSQLSEW